MPTNFSSNAGLAAIASLIYDDDSGGEVKEEKSKKNNANIYNSGGGKMKLRKHDNDRHTPYRPKKNKNELGKKSSLGEAQLYLSMWKL